MRSFEVDLPAAPTDPIVFRTNGAGGYTRSLTEVRRFRGLSISGHEPGPETLVYFYVITPNY